MEENHLDFNVYSQTDYPEVENDIIKPKDLLLSQNTLAPYNRVTVVVHKVCQIKARPFVSIKFQYLLLATNIYWQYRILRLYAGLHTNMCF